MVPATGTASRPSPELPALLLLRHASAGIRARWSGADLLRPLDDLGNEQAAALPGHLGDRTAQRIVLLSSPALRCLQTLEPLAEASGAVILTDDRLLETSAELPSSDGWPDGAWLGARALAAVDTATATAAAAVTAGGGGRGGGYLIVVCSHGDVLPALLAALLGRASLGGSQIGPSRPDLTSKALPKGGAWHLVLEPTGASLEEIASPPV